MNLFKRKANSVPENNPQNEMRLILEHNGTPLFAMNARDFNKEIIIGRSSECTWCLDGMDSSVSAKHAIISRRKSKLIISDLESRNGMFFQNKRIKEKKLAVGDRIMLGECILSVEKEEETAKKYALYHRLAYRNEQGKQIVIDLKKPQIVLGSSPECDIIFHDQLISSHHAEISVRDDGSCWIRDLNSRNGTSVNNMQLASGSERLLQDNDLIQLAYSDLVQVAYIELRFWDMSVEHQGAKIWGSLVAVALTIIIILGGYVAYRKISPSANELIRIAETEMQSGRLESAKNILTNKLTGSEGYSDRVIRKHSNLLLQKIQIWESTIAKWKNVQAEIKVTDFMKATQDISEICNSDMNSWTWKNGIEEKKKAMIIKNLLDACSAADACLNNAESSIQNVKEKRDELRHAITKASPYQDDAENEYFSAAIQYAHPKLDRLVLTLADNEELENTLNLLNSASPDYSAVLIRLNKLSMESNGPVKTRAEKIIPAVKILDRENKRMADMVRNVCSMDFQSVSNFKLELPDGMDYSIEKNIGTLKNRLIERVEIFKDTALQLSLIYSDLKGRGISPEKPVPFIRDFQNLKMMELVYKVDCLDYPLPASNTPRTPIGAYDKLLGIEFFYNYVSNFRVDEENNNTYNEMTLDIADLPFRPEIYRLKENIFAIDRFIEFTSRDENLWLHDGALAEYLNFCMEIQKMRDEIVSAQLKRKDKEGTREYLISRGIATYLSPEGTVKNQLGIDVAKSFTSLKRKMTALSTKYNQSMPEEQLEIRKNILQTALPGDFTLKGMWNQRPANGWEK